MEAIESRIEELEKEIKEIISPCQNELHAWASFYTCAQMVKIYGVENMPKVTLPPNCICKHEFLRQKTEINTLIDRLTLSLESGISQYMSLKSQREINNTQIQENKKKLIDIQGKISCYTMELQSEYQHLYHLMKLNPIDSERFYNKLTPKLDELMDLFNQRLEQKLQVQDVN